MMCSKGKSSHIGSVLSCADILSVLYSQILKINPSNPKDEYRDRFVMSKGHAGAGLYAALSKMGFVDKKVLETHYQNGSDLSDMFATKFSWIELSTGSLGMLYPFV